ncbi:hypothetical protein FKP32DRAFT_1671070 [Trametes sanguinea]|nr:hypothetical protein FKP32DRAFT_1671070 [Trametes sanguinea]
MPVSPEVAAALQYVAGEVSNLNEVLYFDLTRHKLPNFKTYGYNDRRITLQKLGFSQLGSFAGIGYELLMYNPRQELEHTWTIWVANPSTNVAVNRRAVVGGIYAIINDRNNAKVAFTIDANVYAAA